MNSLVEALARRLDRRAAERMMRAEAIAADLSQRATLIGIKQNGLTVTFEFERAGTVHRIETRCTPDDNVHGWRIDLLAPLTDGAR